MLLRFVKNIVCFKGHCRSCVYLIIMYYGSRLIQHVYEARHQLWRAGHSHRARNGLLKNGHRALWTTQSTLQHLAYTKPSHTSLPSSPTSLFPSAMTHYDATAASFGASPKLNPRPKYPPLSTVVLSVTKECVWNAGAIGTVLAYCLFPLYAYSRTVARKYDISDPLFFSLVTSAAHTFLYLTVGGLFVAFDHFHIFQNHKLERKPYMKPKETLVKKMLKEASIGQFITGPIIAYFLYPTFLKFGMMSLDSPLPEMKDLVVTFITAYLFNDIGFYLTHRAFHTKTLYRMFHKQHHEFQGTISIGELPSRILCRQK
jgi:hypothetical protein